MAEKEKPGDFSKLPADPAQRKTEVSPEETKSQAKMTESFKKETDKVNTDMRTEAAKRKQDETTVAKHFSLPNFIDIASIQNIFGSLRDGDYFDAMRQAIAFADKILNPVSDPKLRATPPRSMSVAEMKEFERACVQLEAQVEVMGTHADDATFSPHPRLTASANAVPPETNFGIADVVSIMNIVLALLERFRKK